MRSPAALQLNSKTRSLPMIDPRYDKLGRAVFRGDPGYDELTDEDDFPMTHHEVDDDDDDEWDDDDPYDWNEGEDPDEWEDDEEDVDDYD